MRFRIFVLVLAFGACQTVENKDGNKGFIKVEGTAFVKDGADYRFIGTNFWYGMNLGASDSTGNRKRLLRELDHLKKLGVSNLRIMGGSEGPDSEPYRSKPSLQPSPGQYNQAVLEGLDFLLDEMRKREMHAVVCLNNFWAWSGGMSQYRAWANGDTIPYPPPVENGSWDEFQKYSSQFYNDKSANKLFEDHIRFIIDRKNSINGLNYKDDPTIMAWQLGNEPRGYQNIEAYQSWIHRTAGFIKSLDNKHLVSLGSEGNTSSHWAGTDFTKDHQSEHIDYTTIHIWVENWGWYNPKQDKATIDSAIIKAQEYLQSHLAENQKLNKPMVIEEFGIGRDLGDHDHRASTHHRDRYFKIIFDEVYKSSTTHTGLSGCNFWAWAGEGRPETPFEYWSEGDDLIGDPPHEAQGWYSVYDSDSSTLKLIKNYAAKIKE